MDLCEQKSVSWPPPVPDALKENKWLKSASQREREVICLAALDPECKWVDASQMASRARNSTHEACPTVLPNCKLWHFPSERFVTGMDMMRLQGFAVESLKGPSGHSDNQLGDLAGNAFSASVSLAIDTALLLTLDCGAPSNDEETAMQTSELLKGLASASSVEFEI